MKKKYIIYSLAIILTIFQCYILLKYSITESNVKEIKSNEISSISANKNVKNIRDIKKDFSNYKTLTILSYNKSENNGWILKCLLKGNKEDVLKDIEKINEYKIIDYNLSYENDNILIETNVMY